MADQAINNGTVATEDSRKVSSSMGFSFKVMQQLTITQMPKLLDNDVIAFRKTGDLHDSSGMSTNVKAPDKLLLL